jgi:hypothetical protein
MLMDDETIGFALKAERMLTDQRRNSGSGFRIVRQSGGNCGASVTFRSPARQSGAGERVVDIWARGENATQISFARFWGATPSKMLLILGRSHVIPPQNSHATRAHIPCALRQIGRGNLNMHASHIEADVACLTLAANVNAAETSLRCAAQDFADLLRTKPHQDAQRAAVQKHSAALGALKAAQDALKAQRQKIQAASAEASDIAAHAHAPGRLGSEAEGGNSDRI